MTPEDIARRFERRQGYELIDYAPVVLPLYRLVLDAITMVHRKIPPIKEFVMRSIEAGLDSELEVAGFLGLDDAVVQALFEQLVADRYVTLGDERVALMSERGRQILREARESSPQDEMLVLLYDRLLQKPTRLAAEDLLPPSSVDPEAVIEIRPYPAEGPDIADLSLPEVSQVLADQAGGVVALGRDLLRFKRIAKRTRLYRPAVALVYKKVRGSEIQIAFIIDDARHEGLEHAFAERGGPKKMGFVRAIDESATAGELRRYLGTEVQKLLPESAAYEERRLAVSLARIRYQTAAARAERDAGRSGGDNAEERLKQEAGAVLDRVEGELRMFPARPISPYEPVELLERALNECERRLIITSRDLANSALSGLLTRRVEAALQRGAEVLISLGETPESKGVALDLERLRGRYENLKLFAGRKGWVHHLICDDSFALVCNRPFLGNNGKVRTFEHVSGYLLQSPNLVRAFALRVNHSVSLKPFRSFEAERT